MALPTKQSLPAFLYTKDVVNIDVVPATKSATYQIGELISYSAAVTGTGGYYQGTEINVVKGEKTDPAYTDADDLNFLGVMVERYPPNFFLYQDQAQLLSLEDYTLSPVSFAGDLERMTVCVMPNIVLVDFWDSDNNVAEALVVGDIFGQVQVSQTITGDTGLAGKAALVSANPDSTAAAIIGRLLAIPVSGGTYGYIMLDTLGSRKA